MQSGREGEALFSTLVARLGMLSTRVLKKSAQSWREDLLEKLASLGPSVARLCRPAADCIFFALGGLMLIVLVVGVSLFTLAGSLCMFVASRVLGEDTETFKACVLEIVWLFGAGKTPEGQYIRSWEFENTDDAEAHARLISFSDVQPCLSTAHLSTAHVDVPFGTPGTKPITSRIHNHQAISERNREVGKDGQEGFQIKGHVRYCLRSASEPKGIVVLLHGVPMTTIYICCTV